MSRKILLAVLGGIISLWFLQGFDPALAKFPEKRIRFVVPFAPGGGADVMARPLARFVNTHLNGKVYVENIAGATGAVGLREVLKSPPDGYTMVMMTPPMMTAPYLIKDYPTYDQFDTLCIVAQDCLTLQVSGVSRFATAKELLSYSKTNPGGVSVGVAGVGDTGEILMVAFGEILGTRFNFVPYKSSGESRTATAGGHVDVSLTDSGGSKALVDGGKLRPLIMFANNRSKAYPNVPTARELGYDLIFYLWRGVGIPKGTPKEVKDVLVEAFKKATEDPGFKNLVEQMGMERIFLGPDEAGPYLKGQYEFIKSVAGKMDMKVN